MSNDNIIEIISEYINDEISTQAVLISGEWGSGKTFFVREKLLPEVKRRQEKNNYKKMHYIYISLNGISSIEYITKVLYYHLINKGDMKNKYFDIISLFGTLEWKGISVNQIIELINKSGELTDIVVFMDDLERCKIASDEVLGYINNLTEHNKIKVILIANEEKIENKDVDENKLYSRIKEKAIGITIKYTANLGEVYDFIVNKDDVDKKRREYFKQNKSTILDIFNEKGYCNIRTLIFILVNFKRIYNVVLERDIPDELRISELKMMLEAWVRVCIHIKEGNELSEWSTNEEVCFRRRNEEGDNFKYKAYKFIDDYALYLVLDKEIINRYLDHEKYMLEKDLEQQKRNESLASRRLYKWYELEDEEIEKLIKQQQEELKKDYYEYKSYPYIVAGIADLMKEGFYEEELEKTICIMEGKLKEVNQELYLDRGMVSSVNNRIKYNEVMDRLDRVLMDYKERNKPTIEKYKIEESEGWGEEIEKFYEQNKKGIKERKTFLSVIDTKLIKQCIIEFKVKNIYIFIEKLRYVYCIKPEEYIQDAENVKEVFKSVKSINNEKISSKTKKKAIKELKEILEYIDTKMEKEKEKVNEMYNCRPIVK